MTSLIDEETIEGTGESFEESVGRRKQHSRERSVSFINGDITSCINIIDIDAQIRSTHTITPSTDISCKKHEQGENNGNNIVSSRGYENEFCDVRTIRDGEPELFAVSHQYSKSRVLRDIYNVDVEICVMLRRANGNYDKNNFDENVLQYPSPEVMSAIGQLQRFENENHFLGDRYMLQKQAKKRYSATGVSSKPTAKNTSVLSQDLVYKVGKRGAKYVIDHKGRRRYLTEMRIGNVKGVYNTKKNKQDVVGMKK